MLVAALLAGLLLWLTLGGKMIRDQRNWPALGAILLGLVLLARSELIAGAVLIVGGGVWLRRPKLKMRAPLQTSGRDLIDARDLLGLPPSADREAILTAHRRLITRNHPDNGGTAALAAKLNAARDILLAAQPQ